MVRRWIETIIEFSYHPRTREPSELGNTIQRRVLVHVQWNFRAVLLNSCDMGSGQKLQPFKGG